MEGSAASIGKISSKREKRKKQLEKQLEEKRAK